MRVAHLVPQSDALSSEPTVISLLKYRTAEFREQLVACPGLNSGRGVGFLAAGGQLYTAVDPASVFQRLAQADLIHIHRPSAVWGAKFLEPLRLTGRPVLFTLYGTPPRPSALRLPCVCASATVYETQRTVSPAARMIEMGVDLELFTPPARSRTRPRLVMVRIGPPLRDGEYFWLAADVRTVQQAGPDGLTGAAAGERPGLLSRVWAHVRPPAAPGARRQTSARVVQGVRALRHSALAESSTRTTCTPERQNASP